MNENIDLAKILKDCPKGFQLYSPIFGIVYLKSVTPYNVYITTIREVEAIITKMGDILLNMKTQNVFYSLQKTKEIGLNSLLLGIRKRSLTLRH